MRTFHSSVPATNVVAFAPAAPAATAAYPAQQANHTLHSGLFPNGNRYNLWFK